MPRKSTKLRHLNGDLGPSESAALETLGADAVSGPAKVPIQSLAMPERKVACLTTEERAIAAELYPKIKNFMGKAYPTEKRFMECLEMNMTPIKELMYFRVCNDCTLRLSEHLPTAPLSVLWRIFELDMMPLDETVGTLAPKLLRDGGEPDPRRPPCRVGEDVLTRTLTLPPSSPECQKTTGQCIKWRSRLRRRLNMNGASQGSCYSCSPPHAPAGFTGGCYWGEASNTHVAQRCGSWPVLQRAFISLPCTTIGTQFSHSRTTFPPLYTTLCHSHGPITVLRPIDNVPWHRLVVLWWCTGASPLGPAG
ncbi:hypothetical protein M427DRAFT_130217 [Gonapodya prolifera JEL478]|uniref:Uncharacterized protein n=1 Tax=Gonapodya prolifera (strain JEL478) TaxID=1344416 RepID=A0A139B0P4_GONPJ|nr:hypothetical protein M427DRAFT_130217 [Gonapodya prolifera JEL478]|eukprot:KXS22562.1 hypothetical protein M427DRAFT_130217 [Gonapodya prolifera JEL478]